ncbi:MAG: iron-containing alcohol dehydrogenase [Desulfosoma sp.]
MAETGKGPGAGTGLWGGGMWQGGGPAGSRVWMGDTARFADFFAQPVSLFGVGALGKIAGYLRAFPEKRAVLCTDKGIVAAGIAREVLKVLQEAAKLEVEVFDGVVANPTEACVREGYELYQAHRGAMIISLGGGSAHDAAKAIGVLAAHDGVLWDFVGINKLKRALPPLIAVNTTAGTGSEVTRFAVITHVERKTKLTLVDWRLIPLMAVNDPTLMVGMPPALTAQTGMDAFTHAVEAYLSRNASPLSKTCALTAVALITEHLPKAFSHGYDVEARAAMAYAQYLAGLACNSAGVGAVHAVAHQLGGLYNLPHGLCNAVLLPWIQEDNLEECADRLAEIARAMGEDVAGKPTRIAAEKAVEAMRAFARGLGIPERLGAIGVKEEDLPTIARQAMEDPAIFTNPRRVAEPQLLGVLRNAL